MQGELRAGRRLQNGNRSHRFWLLKAGIAAVALLVLLVAAAGCGPKKEQPAPVTENKPQVNRPQEQEPAKQKVTLYFSDKQGMYLVPEQREVVKGNKPLEQVIIEELIKGPQNPELSITVPREARLLSVKVANGTATVDFSKELRTKHWGGSTGESMTVYSIVNSLAQVPGIKQVQFLLEGQKQESLLGHMDSSMPVAPNWKLVKQ